MRDQQENYALAIKYNEKMKAEGHKSWRNPFFTDNALVVSNEHYNKGKEKNEKSNKKSK